jgi:hypothetical protein
MTYNRSGHNPQATTFCTMASYLCVLNKEFASSHFLVPKIFQMVSRLLESLCNPEVIITIPNK